MTFNKALRATMVYGVIAATAAATASSPARAFTGEELAAEAKIGLAEARGIALKVFAGTIASEDAGEGKRRQRPALFLRHQERLDRA
jgi:hypothetical protein